MPDQPNLVRKDMKGQKFYRILIPVLGLGVLLAEAVMATPASEVVTYSSFKSAYSAGNEALKKGRFAEAVAAYKAAETLASSSKGRCDAFNAAGWALIKSKKWLEAKVVFTEAVNEDQDSKIALKNLGFVCFNLYEYGFSGTDELKNAIQYLGASGENEELLDRAKSELELVESYTQTTPEVEPELTGKSLRALLAMGDEAQAKGQYDLAIKIFKHAATMAGTVSSKALVANRQGKLLLDDRKPREALAYFEEAVKEKPDEKVFLNNLAYSYWVVYDSGKGTVGDLKKSVDIYYRVNSMDSTFHNEMFKMALDELKEIDPTSAGQYTVSDDTADTDEAVDVKGPGDDGDK
jgi:tetratricopeptide (TPR) repeat protein